MTRFIKKVLTDPLKRFFKKCEEWCIIYRLSHEIVFSETPNDKNVF